MTCGAAARTAMVAMIVKAVKVMRQSLSNTCGGDLEDDEDEDEDVQQLVGDLEDDEYEYEDISIVAIMLVTTTTDCVRSTMAANFQSFSMAAVSSSSLSLSVITCFHRR